MSAVLVEGGPDAGAIWHFGEPNHEQRELAVGNAWANLSHRAVITVSGKDRTIWLNDMMTQELATLPTGQWTETLLLDPQGHVEQQLFIVDDGELIWIHTEATKSEELITYLNKMKFMLDVDVRDRTSEFAVVRAPGVADTFGGPYALVLRADLPEFVEAYKFAGHIQVGTWALEAERIAAGRARILFDIDHKSIPNELGLLNIAVHMDKGCYRGQETVAKVFNLGHPPRRLVLLHLDGSMVHMPEHGVKITFDGKEIGSIGSMARHYELGPIALALIKRTVPVDATLDIDGVSATQEVLVPAE
ncbi:MAG: folate-binding protein [Actinomycetota bacterium]